LNEETSLSIGLQIIPLYEHLFGVLDGVTIKTPILEKNEC